MRYAILALAVAALLGLAAFLSGVHRLERALTRGATGAAVDRVVAVPPDAALGQVLQDLGAAGLVEDGPWLELYASRLAAPRRLVPGEYALSSGMSPLDQLARMARGEVVKHAVSLPPGLTVEQVLRKLTEAGIVEPDAGRAAARDAALAQRLTGEPAFEGYLFPDIYELAKGLPADAVLARLAARFEAFVARYPAPERPLPEVVRVASLVQASDVPQREWRVYAALLFNRLDAELPLEHPASAAYGRTKGHDPDDNPYRTDRPGLPPTPITNPGAEALDAALRPATTDARYMVEREDGSHVYCPDRGCYRAAERARRGLPPEPLPAPPPDPPILVTPPPAPPPEPAVVPGTPLDPQPPSETEDPLL